MEIFIFLLNIFKKKSQKNSTAIISEFETSFANRYNYPPALIVSRARIAFYFLLKNMDIKSGGEVLISAIHIADFVNMIHLAGFKPVAVDLKIGTYNIDYEDLERKINKNTVLLLVTHLSGFATDMDRIVEITRRNNIPFIEDCSQAVNTFYKGKRLGTFGKAGIFSLSLLKSVCTLMGGMIITTDLKLLDKLRSNIDQNVSSPSKIPLIMEAVKNIIIITAVTQPIFTLIVFPLLRLNMYREDFFARYQRTNKTVELRRLIPENMMVHYTWQQAVMGLSQLRSLQGREEIRIKNGQYLFDNIISDDKISVPAVVEGSDNTFWLFPIIADNPDRLKRFLLKNGIDSSKFLLVVLSEVNEFSVFSFKCTSGESIKAHTLFIPAHIGVTKKNLDHIIQVLKKYQASLTINT
ncbi:MAG: DegT/DnrJ/EryC1/StrS aminotransferase family protein [Nitrospirae bacterium]|nr:DegT/DnrJ/EryC1/StrS aminotransferase family protein [Nitrospirota bacterium]